MPLQIAAVRYLALALKFARRSSLRSVPVNRAGENLYPDKLGLILYLTPDGRSLKT